MGGVVKRFYRTRRNFDEQFLLSLFSHQLKHDTTNLCRLASALTSSYVKFLSPSMTRLLSESEVGGSSLVYKENMTIAVATDQGLVNFNASGAASF